MSSAERGFVSMSSVTTKFGDFVALDDFRLDLAAGEIGVLVGANGSGKSTLIKTLSGLHSPEPGSTVTIGGQALTFGSSAQSFQRGCRFVHQDLGLVNELSVLDNLALGSGYPTRAGTIQRRLARQRAGELLHRVGVDIDPQRAVGDLTAAEKSGVAIARALQPSEEHPAKLLVLDEPTAALPPPEVDRLFEIMRASAETGVSILFVTHFVEEVFRVGDQVTVLRDGRIRLSSPTGEVTKNDLVTALVGTEVREPEREQALRKDREAIFVIDELGYGHESTLSVSIAAGEVVGLAGLTGSGRDTALPAVFGTQPAVARSITLDGAPLRVGRPDACMRAGVVLVASDRRAATMAVTARENFSLPNLGPFWRGGRLRVAAEKEHAQRWFTELDVRPPETEKILTTFSGGNQQKILFARSMQLEPKVLLLDDPTLGVDIGAKAEIHQRILRAADGGVAVLIASNDVDELVAVCDRVLVLARGGVVTELSGSSLTHESVLQSTLTAV